jgi:hypothetical protein
MHPAAASIKYFGLYVVLTGIGLMLAPGLVLAPLGIPTPTEVWIRVVGALASVVGYYYWHCASVGAVDFFHATVRGRMAFAALMVLLIVLIAAPVALLLFAAVDLAGAAWTAWALRQSRSTTDDAARTTERPAD